MLPKFTQIAATSIEGGLALYGLSEDGRVYVWINDDDGCGWGALPHQAYPEPPDEEKDAS